MPRLEQFSLYITLNSDDVFGEGAAAVNSDFLQTLLRISLPDPSVHTLLTSFTVNISLPNAEENTCPEMLLNIPLDLIPHVSTLKVSTFGRVSFSFARQEEPDQRGIGKHALRELQLRSCTNMDTVNLQATIMSLKDVSGWEALKRVVVRECDALDYDAALLAVGKERLHFSS